MQGSCSSLQQFLSCLDLLIKSPDIMSMHCLSIVSAGALMVPPTPDVAGVPVVSQTTVSVTATATALQKHATGTAHRTKHALE